MVVGGHVGPHVLFTRLHAQYLNNENDGISQ